MTKLLNQRLLATGAGTFSGLMLAVWLSDPMEDFAGGWSGEATSGALVIAGSMMMSQRDRNLQNIGLGLGSAGVSMMARFLFKRFTKPAGNGENGDSSNGDSSNGGITMPEDWEEAYNMI